MTETNDNNNPTQRQNQNKILNTARSRLQNNAISIFYKEHCIFLPAMLGWFIFSALLSTYNKYVFGSNHMAFPCPLLLTSIHFSAQWVFSYTLSSIFPHSLGGYQIQQMAWSVFLSIAIPCGFVTSADIGFSNLALVRITITFYTMVKASTPIFVLLSAYMFGIEKITKSLLMVVFLICIGELLTVIGEVSFDGLGFALCLIAAMCSGFRWTVIQLKIRTIDPPLKSTIATMRLISPFMFLFMVFWAAVLEGEKIINVLTTYSVREGMRVLGIGLLGALLAISMIICEFYLIMKSSAIVLMIGGVLKELTTIMVGVLVFHDEINFINLMGCSVVFLGVIFYKISLHMAKLEKEYGQIDDAEHGDTEDEIVGNSDDCIMDGEGYCSLPDKSSAESQTEGTDSSIGLIQRQDDVHPTPTVSKRKQHQNASWEEYDKII